ncbi:MAG: alanine racemase [Syntrophomonadaceae bacterium]|nr:alanine racemase [Syntrophomonadaceae bacterium]
MDKRGRSWAEINLGAIADNVAAIRGLIGDGVRLMAVVKADAYGHGAVPVAKCVLKAGADYLGVACLEEALELRAADITAPIQVIGFTPESGFGQAIGANIELTVFRAETAATLSACARHLGRDAAIHLKLDTGMGRIGFWPTEESADTMQRIAALPGITVQGLFSHLATADEANKEYAYRQIDVFQQFAARLEARGLAIPVKHIANSAAVIELPRAHMDMVRAGIILYGLYPSPEVDRSVIQLKPAMRFMSRVSQVREVLAGTAVSYGRTFIAAEPRKIVSVPVGYADGYNRRLSNRGRAVINGRVVPVIGRVCMDQTMFDVTGLPEVTVGDEVILFGTHRDGVTADDIAGWLDTINYEVVCMPSRRIPRCY